MLAPGAAATAVRTANLDTAGASYATILVPLGAELNTNSTNVAIQLSESDDTVATNFATFNADYNRTVDNTAATVAVNHLDLRGRKRYIRLTVTPDTTTNGVVLTSAVAVLDKEVRDAKADSGGDVVVGN
jgi:KaiC/GvpD/RAD55 family RecA-like ATPase